MKIKELIEVLKKLDGEMLVCIEKEHMEQGRIIVSPLLKMGEIYSETKQFRDAFDYEVYTSTAYRLDRFNKKNVKKEKVLIIQTGFNFK